MPKPLIPRANSAADPLIAHQPVSPLPVAEPSASLLELFERLDWMRAQIAGVFSPEIASRGGTPGFSPARASRPPASVLLSRSGSSADDADEGAPSHRARGGR